MDDPYELRHGRAEARRPRRRGPRRALGFADEQPTTTSRRSPKRETRTRRTASRRWQSSRRTTRARAGRSAVPEARHPRDLRQALTATSARGEAAGEARGGIGRGYFVLTHNYTGYPMVQQLRAIVAKGHLDAIQVIQVGVRQDWLATPVENRLEAGGLAHRPGAHRRRRLDRRRGDGGVDASRQGALRIGAGPGRRLRQIEGEGSGATHESRGSRSGNGRGSGSGEAAAGSAQCEGRGGRRPQGALRGGAGDPVPGCGGTFGADRPGQRSLGADHATDRAARAGSRGFRTRGARSRSGLPARIGGRGGGRADERAQAPEGGRCSARRRQEARGGEPAASGGRTGA